MNGQGLDRREDHVAGHDGETPVRLWKTPRLVVAEVISVTEKPLQTTETVASGPS